MIRGFRISALLTSSPGKPARYQSSADHQATEGPMTGPEHYRKAEELLDDAESSGETWPVEKHRCTPFWRSPPPPRSTVSPTTATGSRPRAPDGQAAPAAGPSPPAARRSSQRPFRRDLAVGALLDPGHHLQQRGLAHPIRPRHASPRAGAPVFTWPQPVPTAWSAMKLPCARDRGAGLRRWLGVPHRHVEVDEAFTVVRTDGRHRQCHRFAGSHEPRQPR